jgi:heme O synthase-like polyprenyltransferase
MPLAIGERATRWLTAGAAMLLVSASLLPVALGMATRPYLVVASLLAAAAMFASVSGMRESAGPLWARRTFLGSLLYLPLLLGTLVLGAL